MHKKLEENYKAPTAAQIKKVVENEGLSKSAKMKELFEMGLQIKVIAQHLGVRYNFVYNVISNYVNMNGIEVETTKKANKKDAIIELHKAGKTNKEISIDLKTNYNYVYNTVKQYKASLVEAEPQEEVK